MLTALGAAAGVAIENAGLYDEATRQQRWLRASGELTIALLSGPPGGGARRPDQAGARAVRGGPGDLALPQGDGRRLTLEFAEGEGADEARGLVRPGGSSLSGRVLATGGRSPWRLRTSTRDGRVTRLPMGHLGPAVLFPLGTPGNVRGVLTVGRRSGGRPFSPRADRHAGGLRRPGRLALELAAQRADAEQLTVFEDRDRIAQ